MLQKGPNWRAFIAWNILPPASFYFLYQTYGPKPAILVAVIVSALNAGLHRFGSMRSSPFLLVASFFTILFGTLDLMRATPRFLRLEPFVQNLILGIAFAVTVLTRVPIAVWFAEGLPERLRPDASEMQEGYLWKVTVVWTLYFFAKALLFLYLAFQVTLPELFVLRALIGGSSLGLTIFGEILLRKYRLKKRRESRSP